MSETAFHLFNQAFSITAELLYAGLFAAFFRPFLQPGRRGRRLLLLFSLCLLHAALPRNFFGLVLTALLLALSRWTGVGKALTFLLTLLCFNARLSSGLMVESLYFLLERSLPVPSEPPEAVYARAAFLVTLLLLSHAVLYAVMLYALRRGLQKRRLTLHRREMCYLALVPAAGVLFGQIISRLLFEFQDGVLLQLYERHPAFLAVVPVLALLFYAGAWLSIAFQQSMEKIREEQSALYAAYQQAQTIRARIHEAEQFYAHIRRLKHEMRGHLTNLKGLARNGEYASLENYITRMDETIDDFTLTLRTGNPVTDVIVNDIRQRCLDSGIRFQTDLHYPAGFDAFDVGIILQNLLQNAAESCEKAETEPRFISLNGRKRGRFFLLEVKNTFTGEVVFGPDGLPVTTKKEDASLHGIGLTNVRREAEKYGGEVEIKTGGSEFCVTVLLQEKSN